MLAAENIEMSRFPAQDVNDKEPVFNPASQDASINEDIREGTFVLPITATDADTLPNSMLQYSLTVAGESEEDNRFHREWFVVSQVLLSQIQPPQSLLLHQGPLSLIANWEISQHKVTHPSAHKLTSPFVSLQAHLTVRHL